MDLFYLVGSTPKHPLHHPDTQGWESCGSPADLVAVTQEPRHSSQRERGEDTDPKSQLGRAREDVRGDRSDEQRRKHWHPLSSLNGSTKSWILPQDVLGKARC